VPDLTYPDRRLAEFTAADGFPTPCWRWPEESTPPSIVQRCMVPTHGTPIGRWNVLGRRLAAEEPSRNLC